MNKIDVSDLYSNEQLYGEFPLIHAIKCMDYGNKYMPILIELAHAYYTRGNLTDSQVSLLETICHDQKIPVFTKELIDGAIND